MKIICKTKFPIVHVDRLGKFKNGDILKVNSGNEVVAKQLLLGGEWEILEEQRPRPKFKSKE